MGFFLSADYSKEFQTLLDYNFQNLRNPRNLRIKQRSCSIRGRVLGRGEGGGGAAVVQEGVIGLEGDGQRGAGGSGKFGVIGVDAAHFARHLSDERGGEFDIAALFRLPVEQLQFAQPEVLVRSGQRGGFMDEAFAFFVEEFLPFAGEMVFAGGIVVLDTTTLNVNAEPLADGFDGFRNGHEPREAPHDKDFDVRGKAVHDFRYRISLSTDFLSTDFFIHGLTQIYTDYLAG